MAISKDIVQTIIALGIVVGMALGAVSYFATAEDLKLTQMRLEQKILNDSILDIQKRIWALEDRNGGSDCSKWRNEKDKEEYRKLRFELEQKQKEMEKKK